MTIGERIKKCRKELKITQQEIADRIGIKQNSIALIETGKRNPSDQTITSICREFNVNEHWLRTGEGEMFIELNEDDFIKAAAQLSDDPLIRVIITGYLKLNDENRKRIYDLIHWLSDNLREIESSEMSEFKFPLDHFPEYPGGNILNMNEYKVKERLDDYQYFQKISCAGPGFYFDDIPVETIRVPYMEGADFTIGVNGDSMQPDFYDGDIVYVQKTPHLNIGDIGIFIIDGECFIKECGPDRLISHNKAFPDIPGNNEAYIVGRVLGKVEKK